MKLHILVLSALLVGSTQVAMADTKGPGYRAIECTSDISLGPGMIGITAIHVTQACLGKLDNGKDALWLKVSAESDFRLYQVKIKNTTAGRVGANTFSFSGKMISGSPVVGRADDLVKGRIVESVRPGRPRKLTLETESNLRIEDQLLSRVK